MKNSVILNFGDAGWGAIGVSLSGVFSDCIYVWKATNALLYSQVLFINNGNMHH